MRYLTISRCFNFAEKNKSQMMQKLETQVSIPCKMEIN